MEIRNKIILIVVISIIVIFVINSIIPGILFRQQDNLSLILYTCTLGIDRTGSLMLISFNNGTHTIDENSCVWIENTNHKPASMEYQEINEMSCDELLKKQSRNDPYQSKENKIFAESKAANCIFVDNWEDAQKKVKEWK